MNMTWMIIPLAVSVFLFSFQSVAVGQKTAIFAGGCFWCMEPPFEALDGVLDVTAGYTGGHTDAPTYEEVSSGRTGHYEAVRVVYNPERISYERLLQVFWHQIDPSDKGGQFADRGTRYGTAIFYLDEEQRQLAEATKKQVQESGIFDRPVVTAVLPAATFYPAEEAHQNYYRKHAFRYSLYKKGSGRDGFIRSTWQNREDTAADHGARYAKPSDEELKKTLTPLQYKVVREEGTEPPFNNAYWNNKKEGIYVDIVSGEPLFSSTDKFDSGTGWPSFTRPLEEDNIVERQDRRLFSVRTEVRSRHGDFHLGHVFTDGPSPTGLRYCINSAALRFIPREHLASEGYGWYEKLFSGKR